jgi:hypothetical protein
MTDACRKGAAARADRTDIGVQTVSVHTRFFCLQLSSSTLLAARIGVYLIPSDYPMRRRGRRP